MKSVSFSKPVEMLKLQASSAEYMIDRYDAIVALGNMSFEGKSNFLIERFDAEKFHGIKSEIIAQLIPLLDENSIVLAKKGLADEDVEVRKAVLNNTIRIPAELEPKYRGLLQDSSYEVIEQSLELLAFYFTQNINDYLKLTEGQIGNRSHNIAIQRLAIQIEYNMDEKALNELVAYTSQSYEFLTRVKAAQALQELNLLNEEALGHMINAKFSFNSRLRGPVSNVIDHFFEQKLYKRMILNYVSNQEWTDQEFKKVNKYMVP
jgi:hypothetical protein